MPDFDVLFTGRVIPVISEGLEAHFTVHKMHEIADPDAFIARNGHRIGAIVGGHSKARIDGPFMQRFANLRIVGNYGVGYDSIDADWAGKHGIIVTNTPDVLNDEVADFAIGLMIATIRQIPQGDRYLRAGKWLEAPFPLSASLRGRKLGIVGLGRIGKAIARRAAAFGLALSYHGRSPQGDVAMPYYASLLEMAEAVDILMVITPGGEGTRGIINRAVMDALGPHGTLINVARGSVVDEAALIAALGEGTLGSAGLDVFEKEPQVPQALIELPHVVLAPHIASASVHTRQLMGQLVVDNIVSFAAGKGPLTPVPETPWPIAK